MQEGADPSKLHPYHVHAHPRLLRNLTIPTMILITTFLMMKANIALFPFQITMLATADTVAESLESTSSEDPDGTRKRVRKTTLC